MASSHGPPRKDSVACGNVVVMLVDLGEAEAGERKVIDFFDARIFGRVAAAPITRRHAQGIIRAAVADPDSLFRRLAQPPPDGHVHTLVLTRAYGRVALTFAPAKATVQARPLVLS